MKTLETVWFSSDSYRDNIRTQDISDLELAKKIHHKRAKVLSTKTKLSVSFVVTVCTAGLGFPAVVHTSRNLSVRSRKLNVLEVLWADRGPEALPQPHGLEKFKRIAKKVAMEVATMGMDTFDVTGAVVDQVEGYMYVPGAIDTDNMPSVPTLPYSSSSPNKKKSGKSSEKKHSAGKHDEHSGHKRHGGKKQRDRKSKKQQDRRRNDKDNDPDGQNDASDSNSTDDNRSLQSNGSNRRKRAANNSDRSDAESGFDSLDDD